MSRSLAAALAIALLHLPLAAQAAPAEPATRPAPDAAVVGQAVPVAPGDALPRVDPNVFRPGPVRSQDPATRERILGLYREQFDLQRSTVARLKELGQQAGATRDPDALRTLNREGAQLKKDLELHNMELGLEIARLNGDERRAAEFEEALDRLRHPEKWMPVYTPDPELQARRLSEQGITE